MATFSNPVKLFKPFVNTTNKAGYIWHSVPKMDDQRRPGSEPMSILNNF